MHKLVVRLAAFLLILLLFAALLGPWLVRRDPFAQDLNNRLALPSKEYWLGTDELGRCIFTRLLVGTRYSLLIGVTVVSINAFVGTLVGLFSGYSRRSIDAAVMGLIDILMAFPGTILTLAVAGILGPGLLNMIVALTLLGWVNYARFIRGMVLSLKEEEFIENARMLGLGHGTILFRHIFPHCLGPLLVYASMNMAGVILMAAGLSFLGLGVQEPRPEWGAMLNKGKNFLRTAPHLAIFPGLAIMLTTLAFNLLGDGLRDRLQEGQKEILAAVRVSPALSIKAKKTGGKAK